MRLRSLTWVEIPGCDRRDEVREGQKPAGSLSRENMCTGNKYQAINYALVVGRAASTEGSGS